MKLYIVLIFLLISSCSGNWSKKNLIKFISENYEINTEIWEVEDIKIISEFQKNEKCKEMNLELKVVQQKECYDLRNEISNNSIINQLNKLFFNKSTPLFMKNQCVTLKDLESEKAQIIVNYRNKIKKEDICLERENILFGNKCTKSRLYDNEDFLLDEEKIIEKFNSEMKHLKLYKGGKINHLLNLVVCEENGKLYSN